ncbi:MAG: hypothetical protein ACE148_03430 [Vicinamibacterales bacterium]
MTRHERRVPVRMAGRQDRDDEIIRDIEEEEEFDEPDNQAEREQHDREDDGSGYQSPPTGESGSEGGSYGELGRRRQAGILRGGEATETAEVAPVRHGNRRTR